MDNKNTFETNIQRLNSIIKEIENPNTELDISLDLYKEAAQIIASCNKKLNEAQLTVKEITENFGMSNDEE